MATECYRGVVVVVTGKVGLYPGGAGLSVYITWYSALIHVLACFHQTPTISGLIITD